MFKKLLESFAAITEAETKDTKTGRVHKGDYGNKHGVEDVRDQYGARIGKKNNDTAAKKDAPKKGRGRPKKGADDSGEVKTYDSSALSNVFGGGKKPKGEVGKRSVKHSLKEFIESVEDTKNAEAVMEGIFGGVDHASVAANLSKLARVIKSVQTPEQFVVAQKYARRMKGTIMNHQHDKMGFGSGLRANLGVMRDVTADLKAKAAELGIEYNELEEGEFAAKPVQGGQQLQQVTGPDGKPVMGTPLAAPVAQKVAQALNTQPQQGMNEGKTAKKEKEPEGLYSKKRFETDSQRIARIAKEKRQADKKKESEKVEEGKDEGKPGKNFAKIAKSAGKEYGSKAAGERVAGAVKAKLAKQGKLEEAKPDFLDVDKDKNKKETFKKAVADKKKKKVAESRIHEGSEYTHEIIAKSLAQEKPDLDVNSDEFFSAVYHEAIEIGLTPKAARYKLNYDDDFLSDVASAYSYFQRNPSAMDDMDHSTQHDMFDKEVDEGMFGQAAGSMAGEAGGTALGAAVGGPVGAAIGGQLGSAVGGAIGDTLDEEPKNFLQVLSKKPETRFESKKMKDIQLESWESQLDSLLNEGISVSSSTGQQGSPDSVSVTATDGDSQALLAALRNAGIGVFGGHEQSVGFDDQQGHGVASQGEEEAPGHGADPEESPSVVGDGDDMMALIKKMTGIETPPTQGFGDSGEEEGQDYEDEGGEQAGTLEPASDEEGSDEESEEGSDEEEDKEETDEGNAFTGKLKQTPQGGTFKQGGKEYKDTSEIEEGGFDPERFGSDGSGAGGAGGGDIKQEGEETCNECGMMESECECDHEHVEESYANSDDDQEMQDFKFMLQSLSGGLNGPKRSQATGNVKQVTMGDQMMKESRDMLVDWKKLSGI